MRFRNLGSGSSGNATLVEATGIVPLRVLVDCGLGIRQLLHRLGEAGLQAQDIHAVFITHEHGDHIGCARALALRYRIPVWMSQGTHSAIGAPDFDGLLHRARDGKAIDLGGLQLTPFTVPHDAREPLQLSCTDGAAKLGILTDLGHASRHVLDQLAGCNALLLESNHDEVMLSHSKYPAFLKARVGGDFGHLSNMQAAEILSAVMHDKLRHVSAAHLSLQNNHPSLAQSALAVVMGCMPAEIVAACPEIGTPWLTV